jgi:hypothetical protein
MADLPAPPSRRERLRKLFLEYGALALAVHYAIYLSVLLGFVITLQYGVQHAGSAPHGTGTLGVWAAAYLATKLAMPLRALGTLTLTPLLRALVQRVRKSHQRLPAVAEAPRAHERG